MCGISAIISKNGSELGPLIEMNDIISHRGPDDEGFFLHSKNKSESIRFFGQSSPKEVKQNSLLQDALANAELKGNVLLGHRRLSIRDISPKGHQPMTTDCGRYTIVYNGEIYNSDELKSELLDKGYTFQSTTDTEVLLCAFAEWQEGMLTKLNGMFSFLIFDQQNNTVFLARDRFGVKPLYYRQLDGGGFAFASEIKQFTKLNDWRAKLNHDRAFDFLNWGQTDHTNETMFKDVYHIPPGHYARLSIDELPEKLKTVKWYSISKKLFKGSFKDAVAEFKSLLIDSVSLRLKADVSVGTCLSGGLDSSSIVCTVNEILNGKQVQKTFSSCSEHPKFDESDFVHEVLNRTKNVEPHLFNLEHSKFLSTLPQLIYHQDEPFLSPSVFAEWSVFQKVSENNVKVTLDGHGADEQLCGYHTFFGPLLFSLFKRGMWIRLVSEMIALKKLHGYGLMYSIPKIVRGILPDKLNQLLFKITNRPTKDVDWIDLDVLQADNMNEDAIPDVFDVNQLSLQQMTLHSLPKQLRWCDRDSMAFSVESRAPFIDYRVVEFLASLPTSFKLEGGITKKVLREAMDSYLPPRVKNRIDKMGFVTPAEIWVKESPELYMELVDGCIEKSKGVLNEQARNRLQSMIRGKQKFDHSFWRALFFAEWMHCFDVEV